VTVGRFLGIILGALSVIAFLGAAACLAVAAFWFALVWV
jgi:hypothetical protein